MARIAVLKFKNQNISKQSKLNSLKASFYLAPQHVARLSHAGLQQRGRARSADQGRMRNDKETGAKWN